MKEPVLMPTSLSEGERLVERRCAACSMVTLLRRADGTYEVRTSLDADVARVLLAPSMRERYEDVRRSIGPGLRELAPGMWAMSLPRVTESRGTWIVLGLSRSAPRADLWRSACREAGVPARWLAGVPLLADASPAALRATAAHLALGVADLEELGERREAVQGFTLQLASAFETIDMLYSIGRSMSDPTRPREFLGESCERLRSSGEFGWTGVCFSSDPGLPAAVRGFALHCGAEGHDGLPFDAAARIVLARLDGQDTSRVLRDEHGLPGDSQVIAQPLLIDGRCVGVLLAGDKGGVDASVSSYDIQLVEAAGRFAASFLGGCALYERQEATFVGTIGALSAAIDAKDPYTQGHSERVAMLSRALARAAGMPDEQAERVHIAGLVHDVGKIGVPEAVLCKQGRLTAEEFAVIKQHPEIGHRILRGVPTLADVLPGVLHHHERFDGRGYPAGLSGEAIPRIARILAVADTFDAMSSTRSYRSAMPRDKVLSEIAACAGTQFDPDLARIFVTLDLTLYDEMVRRAEGQQRRAA